MATVQQLLSSFNTAAGGGGGSISTLETGFPTAGSTHNVSMPASVSVNDLLICAFTHRGSGTATTPSGWTLLTYTNNGGGCKLGSYYKVADGSEGGTTVNFATTTNGQAEAIVYHVPAGTYTGTPEVSGTFASSANPNPPLLTPSWGMDDVLWIAVFGCFDQITVSVYPLPDNNEAYSSSAVSSVSIGSCTTVLSASSEDPGTFTISASKSWLAHTIGLRYP